MSGAATPRAAVIAIGTEMLGPLRQDTNSLWLAARLEEVGVSLVRKSVVPDDPAAIARELAFAAGEASLLFTTGGLGPTADDVTVPAVARWLGVPIQRDPAFLAKMRARFERRGIPMAAVNEKQADFLVGATVLENARGTAPGFWARGHGVEIIVLPGVPSEMREIMEASILPELKRRAGSVVSVRRILRIGGMAESAVEELITPVYEKWKDDPVTILASPGEVQLHLVARGVLGEAQRRLDEMEADFRSILGEKIFGRDGEELAASLGRLLRESGRTLAVAESCTGGMVSSLLTDIPGSSAYFLGAVVSYADSAKTALLDVSDETLERHGAVSEETAREMARGALGRFGADLAAALTGIAGPDGGTPEKPVGTVFVAVCDRTGTEILRKRQFSGDRGTVRRAASLYGLELLRRHAARIAP
jgi:nicotinamide-nucleotide amidase